MNDGGPAFPNVESIRELGDYKVVSMGGMSMRDYFAGQVLAGMAASSLWADHVDCGRLGLMTVVARSAYAMADAMLKAREERKS